MITLTHIEAMDLPTHTHHMAPRIHGIMFTTTSVMKMGNIASRVGIKDTYLAFQGSVLTITPYRVADITTPESLV